jgi:O-succinylbenzoic acid--CoA ligase
VSRAWVLARARRTPGALAVAFEGRSVTWRELARAAHARAAGLRAAGLVPGDLVATRLPSGLAAVELLHAAQIAGLAWLPIHARLTEDEVRRQLRHAGPAAFFDGEGALPEPADPAGLEPAAVDPSRDLLVLFTSGTTGRLRAARLTAANLAASARASARVLGAAIGDRWLACLPLYHVGGLSILVRSVLWGAAVELHPRFDAERVAEALEARATHASLVPTMLRRVLEREATGSAGSKGILLGGAAAPPALVARAWERGLPVLPTYGLTEAASQVATAEAGRPPVAGSVGRPLPGTRVRIVARGGEPVEVGDEGEIQVRGPTVFAGYLRDPEATRAAMDGPWLRTGDVGALDRHGRLRVLDRRSDLIVSGGENVAPAEVEAVLLDHPEVEEAGVAGRPDDDLGQVAVAFVVPRPGRTPSPEALRRFCRERLAGYKTPRTVTVCRELPRNALGKLLRDRLGA